MNFGQKLKQLRTQKGLTQQKLAEKLGYKTNSYISDVESRRFIPSKEKLKKIAKALGVSFKGLDGISLQQQPVAATYRMPLIKDMSSTMGLLPLTGLGEGRN